MITMRSASEFTIGRSGRDAGISTAWARATLDANDCLSERHVTTGPHGRGRPLDRTRDAGIQNAE